LPLKSGWIYRLQSKYSSSSPMEVQFQSKASPDSLFRPAIDRLIPAPRVVVVCIFVIHAILRFGGMWNAQYIALSMVVIWPLPWLLSARQARRKMGFRAPQSWQWFVIGSVLTIVLLAFCAAMGWLFFGETNSNWFTRHAMALHEALKQVPAGASLITQFWIVTLPAMIFSPLAEEFLYRGFILTAFSMRWGCRTAMAIQASAFALVHLAHYGLNPFQPALISIWLPSMFITALVFGWIVQKSRSVWPAVVSHSIFNLGMNEIVFLLLPQFIGE